MPETRQETLEKERETLEQSLLHQLRAGHWKSGRFEELALQIHRFQRRACRLYDRFCNAMGAGSVQSWRQIPAVPQGMFKRFDIRTFSGAPEAVFHTSGTTGGRRGRHFLRSLALYRASVLSGWRSLLLPNLRQLILIPRAEEAPDSSLSRMMSFLAEETDRQEYFVRGNQLLVEALARRLEEAEQQQEPVLLLGTALMFLHFLDRTGSQRFRLPRGSALMETGGYKGSSSSSTSAEALYTRIEQRLGLPQQQILNEYGMTELSAQCYRRGDAQTHSPPPWLGAVVIDPATGLEADDGGEGILRFFDLTNLHSSMAVETRDLAVRHGSGFRLLGRDPGAVPRGCSRAAAELLQQHVVS